MLGRRRPSPHSIKGPVSPALGSLFGRRSYVTLLSDTSLVAGSSVASSLVIFAPSSRSPYASLATFPRIVNLTVQGRATVLASPFHSFPGHRRAYRPQEVGVQNRARTTPRSRRVEPAHKRKGINVTPVRVAPSPPRLAGRHPSAGGLIA